MRISIDTTSKSIYRSADECISLVASVSTNVTIQKLELYVSHDSLYSAQKSTLKHQELNRAGESVQVKKGPES